MQTKEKSSKFLAVCHENDKDNIMSKQPSGARGCPLLLELQGVLLSHTAHVRLDTVSKSKKIKK